MTLKGNLFQLVPYYHTALIPRVEKEDRRGSNPQIPTGLGKREESSTINKTRLHYVAKPCVVLYYTVESHSLNGSLNIARQLRTEGRKWRFERSIFHYSREGASLPPSFLHFHHANGKGERKRGRLIEFPSIASIGSLLSPSFFWSTEHTEEHQVRTGGRDIIWLQRAPLFTWHFSPLRTSSFFSGMECIPPFYCTSIQVGSWIAKIS